MNDEAKQRCVIFDTDMGADDAWALQMILKAEKSRENVKVLAITTVHGNATVENVIKNTYRILDGLDRTDIPIYKGATEPLIPEETKIGMSFGSNGFCDVEFWKPHYPTDINEIIQRQNAVEIIRELVIEHPHEISLICLGPLTNIAMAIKTYPEIKKDIKDVFIMGGNCKGRGNALAGSEFNFYMDPEAANIALNSLKCPMTIVPLECASEIDISLDWRFNVLGSVDHTNVQLLNEIEQIAYRGKQFYTPFDSLLVAVFLFPEKCIQTKYNYHATVELQGLHTRGQIVFNLNSSKHNVCVIETVYQEETKTLLLWAANA
ncbi:nucleoside hydrolase-like [Sitodiplosis mosellana]|uniref:nucleoside hydrolase-like n=1 Tax=Sitodiplosis mosellana TaxID=263140 RepID=UPI0024453820|nr:nucleoside hydrolase-like [Sitodiplosis mosellana]